jgi:hypothetical protein
MSEITLVTSIAQPIYEDREALITSVLKQLVDSPEHYQAILELLGAPLDFLRSCKAIIRLGFTDLRLIDVVLGLLHEYKNDSEIVFECFKVLGLIGAISAEHIFKVRECAHDLLKISRTFPHPEWLHIVAWNL